MKCKYRNSVLALAVASALSLPAWSASPAETSNETSAPGLESSAAQFQDKMKEKQSTPDTSDARVSAAEKQTITPNPMMSITPDDLYQRDVIGSEGEKIGQVTDVVSHRESGSIYTVISTGGFLGLIGGTRHVIPLSELHFENKQLHLDTNQEGLSQRKRYEKEVYTLVEPHDQPISEFSAFEPAQ